MGLKTLAPSEVIRIPSNIAQRFRAEAEKQGMGLEEYLIDLITQDLDPPERALEYVRAARELLDQAREELEKGDVRQAAEKVWDSAALAVKAYAAWREGKRLASHRDLWEYTLVMRKELGKWVSSAWNAGNSMHVCFYEGWCSKEHVEDAIEEVERLVRAVEEKIERNSARQ